MLTKIGTSERDRSHLRARSWEKALPTSATRSTVSHSWPTSSGLALLNLDTRSTANIQRAGQLPRSLSLSRSTNAHVLSHHLHISTTSFLHPCRLAFLPRSPSPSTSLQFHLSLHLSSWLSFSTSIVLSVASSCLSSAHYTLLM